MAVTIYFPNKPPIIHALNKKSAAKLLLGDRNRRIKLTHENKVHLLNIIGGSNLVLLPEKEVYGASEQYAQNAVYCIVKKHFWNRKKYDFEKASKILADAAFPDLNATLKKAIKGADSEFLHLISIRPSVSDDMVQYALALGKDRVAYQIVDNMPDKAMREKLAMLVSSVQQNRLFHSSELPYLLKLIQ